MPPTSYTAAVATFRRPDSLREMLLGLGRQTVPPQLVVVADNDPERSGQAVVDEIGDRLPIDYLPMPENLGPAGAWSAAVGHAQQHERRGDWAAVFDDDDPIADLQVMARLLEHAGSSPPDVAAVGLRGARLRPRSATLERVRSMDPGTESVDYLASGGVPVYRWTAIDRVGFFDSDLFFGFEDLELGLRLRHEGFRLAVEPMDEIHAVADTAGERSPWREYFKTRALVVICRRHLGAWALAMTLVRSLVVATPMLCIAAGPRVVSARWHGAFDGLRGRLGARGWAPSDNPAKKRPDAPVI